MKNPPHLAERDKVHVTQQFHQSFTGIAPDLVREAERLLARISPPRWALEWSLPLWLGDALGLDHDRSLALTCANVLGLGYVRLQDDLYDGDLSTQEMATVIPLGVVLYQRWTRVYIDLLGADATFWDYHAGWMAEWAHAMQASRTPVARPFDAWAPEDFAALGSRGAPLKVCVAATCLLTGQAGHIEVLAPIVDNLLVAAVLFDHVQDWEADLAAGRPNAFVAYICDPRTVPESGSQARRSIVQEWTVGRAGAPYFRLIEDRLKAVESQAQLEGLTPLARFARWLRRQASRYRREMADDARAWLRSATRRLVDPPPEPEAPA